MAEPVVRHREQGRPAGGRQRPQPGGEGARAAVRLPRHRRRRSPGRARRRSASRRRPRSGSKAAARRLQGEAGQAEHLAEGARRRRARARPARSTRSTARSSRASTRTRPRRSARRSATRGPRACRRRSRATSCGSPARRRTTCRPSSPCSRASDFGDRPAVHQLPVARHTPYGVAEIAVRAPLLRSDQPPTRADGDRPRRARGTGDHRSGARSVAAPVLLRADAVGLGEVGGELAFCASTEPSAAQVWVGCGSRRCGHTPGRPTAAARAHDHPS